MFQKKLLAKQAPLDLLRQMTSELDRMFDEPWSTFGWPTTPTSADGVAWAPKVDVLKKDNQLVTRVDLPGVAKDDVLVEARDGMLLLSGERKKESKEEKDNVYREEREYGSFCRSLPLPKGVKADDIKASFANGVLEVCMPLPPAADEAGKKIAITDGTPAKAA